MKIEKLHLSKDKLDINLQFYFFLKYIVKLKPTYTQSIQIIELLGLFNNVNTLPEKLNEIFNNSSTKLQCIEEITSKFSSQNDIILFSFAFRLHQIKDLLLEEAKITQIFDLNNFTGLHPLSLEYDKISVLKPYKTRVSGALISLLFFEKLTNKEFNFISKDSVEVMSDLSNQLLKLKKIGLESNQIFMLIFNESINQSIIADSGSNYESRILSVLNKNGINNITKTHDKNDKSTEYDFFFDLQGKTYGIGAKRTLRERYKQFIKTSLTSHIDVSIQITLGTDLTEKKAKTIIKHGIYIFVSHEIYKKKKFLRELDKVYSVNDLNKETLLLL